MSDGTLIQKTVSGGRIATIAPLLFGKYQLSVGKPDVEYYDDSWSYSSLEEALVALLLWEGEGEPHGWFRHTLSGRRRPDGDPSKEYVRL